MSYIPPHKRNLKDPVQPSPFPDSLLPKFRKNINYRNGNCLTKWFLFGSYVDLVPFSSDSSGCILKASVLMNNDDFQKESEEEEEERTRWLLLAEKVADDLVFAYEQAKKRMEDHQISDHKLRLAARFGKIVFLGDVPTSFIQNIKSKVIPSHEFCVDGEKEKYIVGIIGPNGVISCKCKAELSPVRHLTIEVSRIDKNLDMRLMLRGERKTNILTEKEISDIEGILGSAIVGLNVKGKLTWPLGKTSFENGYELYKVCHVGATTYKTRTFGLKVRDIRYGTGEVDKGVTLILKEMNTKLQEQNIERGCLLEKLRDVLGTIWDFLSCDVNLM